MCESYVQASCLAVKIIIYMLICSLTNFPWERIIREVTMKCDGRHNVRSNILHVIIATRSTRFCNLRNHVIITICIYSYKNNQKVGNNYGKRRAYLNLDDSIPDKSADFFRASFHICTCLV